MTNKFKFTPDDILSMYSEPEKAHTPETISKLVKTPEQMEKEAEEIMNNSEKKRSKQREEEETEKQKEIIINAYSIDEGSLEAQQYFKDAKTKIEDKLVEATDPKMIENLQRMLKELKDVEYYDYAVEKKKSFKKTESEVKPIEENITNEVLDESKKTDKKVPPIFTKGEPTKEEIESLPYVPYQGSMKVAVDLPLMESELKLKKEKTNVAPEGEVKKVLPEK